MKGLLTNYYETAAIILFGIGFATLMLHSNLIKKIIGMNIMDTAIFLFFIAKGYIFESQAPIIRGELKTVYAYVNPVPSALMLTGIVVAVTTTAFALALTIKLNEKYHTVDLDKIMEMEGDKNDE
ncbi:MAG: cation:proton antiporter subunit C [Tissierellales bacterium]|jgi:multicomponent Na+:H+ antiporter subunit C|nr:cation:proton antiporter subunit C [Tissierellales bacterium]MBN2828125.1 cation:proton antiporter subunit C [Tissierellales bacterium]